jgi:ATP synthase I chain
MTLSDAFYEAVERRIERLTLAISAAAAVFAGLRWGWRSGLGVAVGGILSWLNFRWLDQGIGQLLRAAAGNAEVSHGPASRWLFLRFLGRTVLILLALYVILKTRRLPGKALLAGLFSVICAASLEVSYEVATGFREPKVRR